MGAQVSEIRRARRASLLATYSRRHRYWQSDVNHFLDASFGSLIIVLNALKHSVFRLTIQQKKAGRSAAFELTPLMTEASTHSNVHLGRA
jgi:hypothetical protein